MRGLVLRWFINAVALFLAARVIEGMEITGFSSALVAAFVLGVVNAIIRPVILFITLPINIITLGLFTLIVNAVMLKLVDFAVEGLRVEGFLTAFIGAILLSVFSMIGSSLIKDKGERR